MQRLVGGIEGFNVWIGQVARWAILAMVVIGAFNAVARYSSRFIGVNLSSNGLLEAQWYLFAVVFLLCAPYTLAEDRHVRVDVLYGRLSEGRRAAIDLAGTLLFLIPLCAFGVWICLPSVSNSWSILEQSPDPGGLPRYPVKTLLPVALVLLGLQGIASIPARIRTLRRGR